MNATFRLLHPHRENMSRTGDFRVVLDRGGASLSTVALCSTLEDATMVCNALNETVDLSGES